MTFKLNTTEFRINSFSSDAGIEKVLSVTPITSINPIKNIGAAVTRAQIDSTVKSALNIRTEYTLARLGVDTQGNTVLLRYQIPDIPGLIARYNVDSFDVANQVWNDTVGSYHASVSRGTVGITTSSNGNFDVLFGTTADGIRFPSGILPSTFTLFHVTRYTSTTQGRIVTGYNNNWLDGHWGGAAGVAYHEGWLTNQTDRFDQNWVVSSSQNSLYRGEGTTYGTSGGSASTALSINHGAYAEYSDWEIAEVIVFNRHLTLEEIQAVEGELAYLYPVSIITPIVAEVPLPFYEDLFGEQLATVTELNYSGDSSADHSVGELNTSPQITQIVSTQNPVILEKSIHKIVSNSKLFSYTVNTSTFNTVADSDSGADAGSGDGGGGGSGSVVVSSGPTQIWY